MRIPYLQLRWLRLRHGWPVLLAHHPLCNRYANETWRLRGCHVCRGCACLALGLALGTCLVIAAGGAWTTWALALLGPPIAALSWPAWYHRLPRWLRDVLRAAAGVVIALLAWTVGTYPIEFWPVLVAAILSWWLLRRARAKALASRCEGCPELGVAGVCSGYRLQTACVRALEADLEARLDTQLSGFLDSNDQDGPEVARCEHRASIGN